MRKIWKKNYVLTLGTEGVFLFKKKTRDLEVQVLIFLKYRSSTSATCQRLGV
jgi:hypothetical protein